MNLETPTRIALVIDDEIQIRRLLKVTLEAEHYRIYEADNGQGGLIEIVRRKPDVVLLDLGLPDMDGIDVLRRLREWSKVPVLVLSVRQGVEDKVAALDAGADDYLTKPFHSAELNARLRAIQRHATTEMTEPAFRMRFAANRFCVTHGEIRGRGNPSHRDRIRAPSSARAKRREGGHAPSASA